MLLLEDGIALVAPPAPLANDHGGQAPLVVGMLHLSTAPEVFACSANGALLGVGCGSELSFYIVSGESSVAPTARLRGRARLSSKPKGLDVTTLGGSGVGPASVHGVAAIASAAGLALVSTATDYGVEAKKTHHAGVACGACRFSDDGIVLALASMDGRLFVRRVKAADGWATGSSELVWCAHCPCERVLSLDFSACGRWLAMTGWLGDAAVYDGATFATAQEPSARNSFSPTATTSPEAGPCEIPWQDWRLAWLQPAVQGAATAAVGPALAVCCRAHCARSVMLHYARPLPNGEHDGTLSSLRQLSVVDASRGGQNTSQLPESISLGTGPPIRGLCTARVAGAHSKAGTSIEGEKELKDGEVALWMDETGKIGWCCLWSWGGVEEEPKAAARSVTGDGSTSDYILATSSVGTVRVCASQPVSADVASETHARAAISIVLFSGASSSASTVSTAPASSSRHVTLSLPELADDALKAALASSSRLHAMAGQRFSVLLSSSHVAVLSPGVVQYAEARTGGTWSTVLAGWSSACFISVSDHLLLLLVDADGDGDMDAGSLAPRLVLLSLSAESSDGTNEGCDSHHATALTTFTGGQHCQWSDARLLPMAERTSATGDDESDKHFALLLPKRDGNSGFEAWIGEVSEGGAAVPVRTSTLRVVCEPQVAPDGMGASSFRLLNPPGGLAEPVVELLGPYSTFR